MATHCVFLPGKLRTEEPGGPYSMGWQRAGHIDKAIVHTNGHFIF